MRTFLVGSLGLCAILLTATAGAQAAVGKCSQECDPKDPDVNGSSVVTNGPVKVIAYAHFEAGWFPNGLLNLQKPNRTTWSSSLLLLPSGTPPDHVDTCAEWPLENSPGLVQYMNDGSWRTHQEPGLGADLHLRSSGNVFYFYLQAGPGNVGSAPPAGIAPLTTVDIRIESGRFLGRGTLYAHGTSSAGLVYDAPNGPVWEFRIPLIVDRTPWSGARDAAGFLTSARVCQATAGANRVSTTSWRAASGPDLPTRLVLNMEAPLILRGFEAVPHDGELFVRTSFQPVFGSYDVTDASARLQVQGPRGVPPDALQFVILKRSVDMDGQFKPVNATWKLDPRWVNDGQTYRFTFSVENRQQTYRLVESLNYQAGSYPGRGVPAPELGLVVVALAMVARRLRR